jgi:hypothetical protein
MDAESSHGHHADCTPLPLAAGLMADRAACPAGGNVTGDDLIVAAPWLAFAAGLAVIGWRLAVGRRRRRRDPPRPAPPDRSVAQNGQRRNR